MRRGSIALQRLLDRVLSAVGPPNGGKDYAASLRRNRQIQQLLTLETLRLAEERYPGFQELLGQLHAKEREFILKSGPMA